MTSYLTLIVAAVLGFTLIWIGSRWRIAARAEYIRNYAFPMGLFEKLRKKRPELTLKDCQLVSNALRQFFLTYLKSGRKYVSMPSQVADDLWHELILYTKTYERFCKGAFGRFLHHTPAAALSSSRQSNTGLRRCWWYACLEDHIDPRKPNRLPLLFALDAKLNIPDGFLYTTDCKRNLTETRNASSTVIHCGGDFSSPDFDGTTDGFSDSFGSDGGDSGGCGDGCGGGGGCGGGD